jgi:50S ribosomal protein L16 3-hydroxylase
MRAASTKRLLGGRDPQSFLAKFWQKRSALIRGALPGFTGVLTLRELLSIAERDDVESRLVIRERERWSLTQGPFRRSYLKRLPPRDWTLLVQDVNLVHARADALLRRFSFIPFARMDDLMVSYAAPGGGVGPHFDSYDVFLLQGSGRRRWRYGRQRDLSLAPDLPLKILLRFTPREEHVLAPGDMLYLPPHYAHDGIAVDACTTYSIGFRAPSKQEWADAFLDFMRDHVALEGRYADPDLRATRTPARIDAAMRRALRDTLARIRWDDALTAQFVGCMLSEPKPGIRFTRPARPLIRARFAARIARQGLVLDRAAQLLYDNKAFYMNGAVVACPRHGGPTLRTLANGRVLAARDCARAPAAAIDLLHQWYRYGFVTSDPA